MVGLTRIVAACATSFSEIADLLIADLIMGARCS
jgi:hypothetical protein